MKYVFLCGSLVSILLLGCKKEHNAQIEIYLLKSFVRTIDTTQRPAVNGIANAVLDDTPLVADPDIRFYTRKTSTFTLRKDIQTAIKNFGPDKAFAVTVDKQIVYYGRFYPMYMSSVVYGLATITPLLYKNNELRVDFINLTGTFVSALDKRNDGRIINALRSTDRLK
jgi:hypothetical protein